MKQLKKLFCLLSVLLIVSGCAAQQPYIQQVGPGYYLAGAPTLEFELFAAPQVYGKQRQANWGWAASVQMVLNYHGLYVDQEQVVTRIYGGLVDQPANEVQIREALSGWAYNIQGKISHIYSQSGFYHPNEITQNLAYKWPLIVGLRNPNGGVGHAYVLTGIYYYTDYLNNTIPDRVILCDPWPTSASKQEITWNEFRSRLMMAHKIWVSR